MVKEMRRARADAPGFGLLDEKRILIAEEILRLARNYETVASEAAPLRRASRDPLAAAVERHGIDALQVYRVRSAAPMPPLVGPARYWSRRFGRARRGASRRRPPLRHSMVRVKRTLPRRLHALARDDVGDRRAGR